ncbi:MAG: right-handed parallel beta-helix repeat-containing protein [Candidatus Micrarchaeota archaeon]
MAQGGLEYILIVGGVLLIVVIAMVIIRGGTLGETQENIQAAGANLGLLANTTYATPERLFVAGIVPGTFYNLTCMSTEEITVCRPLEIFNDATGEMLLSIWRYSKPQEIFSTTLRPGGTLSAEDLPDYLPNHCYAFAAVDAGSGQEPGIGSAQAWAYGDSSLCEAQGYVKMCDNVPGAVVLDCSTGTQTLGGGQYNKYCLEADQNAPQTCAVIGASNVELDCQNHLITGNDAECLNNYYGIQVGGGLSGITVKNCVVTGFCSGIYSASTDSEFANNYAHDNNQGFYFAGSNNVLSGNRACSNTGAGFTFDAAQASFTGDACDECSCVDNTATGGLCQANAACAGGGQIKKGFASWLKRLSFANVGGANCHSSCGPSNYPQVTLNEPINSFVYLGTVGFNFTPTDDHGFSKAELYAGIPAGFASAEPRVSLAPVSDLPLVNSTTSVANGTVNTLEYTLTVPSQYYQWFVQVCDDDGQCRNSTREKFAAGYSQWPVVTLNAPVGGAGVYTGVIAFNFTPTDDEDFTPPSKAELYLSSDGGMTYVLQNSTTSVYNNSLNTLEYDVASAGSYFWIVQVCDNDGQCTNSSDYFSACSSGPQTISYCDYYINGCPGEYVLDSDLSCLGNGISVYSGGSNSVIDCQGHSLTGPTGSGAGVTISDATNVTVENCVIKHFSSGVTVSSSNNFFINNSLVENSEGASLYPPSAGNNFTDNNISSNTIYGIKLQESTGAIVDSSEISYNPTGIYAYWGGGHAITNNNISFNSGNGLYAESASGITIDSNEVSNNGGKGISAYYGGGHTIQNNNISHNNHYGIDFFTPGTGSTVFNNNASDNAGCGLYLYGPAGAPYHNISYNEFSYTRSGDGLCGSTYAVGTIIEYNTMNSNSGNGITLSSAYDSLFSHNTLCGNTYDVSAAQMQSSSSTNNTCGINKCSQMDAYYACDPNVFPTSNCTNACP